MTNCSTASELIKNTYDLDTLKEIRDHGCITGVANEHIYYYQTLSFFEEYEDEIVETVSGHLGEDYLVECFKDNDAHLTSYKNAIVWTFVELTAMQLLDEFETTMTEYEQDCNDQMLSTSDEPIKLYADYSKIEASALKANGFEVVNT